MNIRGYCIQTCLLVLSLTSAVGVARAEQDTPSSDDCAALLERFHPQQAAAGRSADSSLNALMERYKLTEFFTPDASGESVASRHPMFGMNANRLLAWISKHNGVRVVRDPRDGQSTIREFAALSDGVPEAGGRKLVGHPTVGEATVSHFELGADGFKTALRVPTFVGNPGSGKSESLTVYRKLLRHHTLNNPDAFMYATGFENLDEIPIMRAVFGTDPDTGKVPDYEDEMSTPPDLFLPEEYQIAVRKQIEPKLLALDGRMPSEATPLNPKAQWMRDQIILHYSTKYKRKLTAREVFDVLNRHLFVKRVVLGDPGTCPLIDFQNKGVSVNSLVMTEDLTKQHLPVGHPMRYNYGAILRANRGVVFLDEILKNPPDMLNTLLGLIQSRQYATEGGPTVSFDVAFLAGTNRDDVRKLEDLVKAHRHPLIDRLKIIAMDWAIRPHEIAQILLYEVPKMQMAPLGEDSAAAEPVRTVGNIEKLFPARDSVLKAYLGPDGRYRLYVGEDAHLPSAAHVDSVAVSPHALMFMARVISLTRMEFDPKKLEAALSAFGQKTDNVPAPPALRNEIERLALLEGTSQFNETELKEYWRFSDYLNEGTWGISSREASEWLGNAVAEARKPGRGNTITAGLLQDVLDDMIRERRIGSTDSERPRIAFFARLVKEKLVKVGYENDLRQGIERVSPEAINRTHDQIFADLKAVANGQATRDGRPINTSRLQAIAEIYKRQQNGRDLKFEEIRLQTSENERFDAPVVLRRNPGLLEAVREYYTQNQMRAAEAQLENAIHPDINELPEDRAFREDLFKFMRTYLGYSEEAVKEAIALTRARTGSK